LIRGVVGGKLPMGVFGVTIPPNSPGGDLLVNFIHVADAPTQTLFRQYTDIKYPEQYTLIPAM
jgi:hypothetical protein